MPLEMDQCMHVADRSLLLISVGCCRYCFVAVASEVGGGGRGSCTKVVIMKRPRDRSW